MRKLHLIYAQTSLYDVTTTLYDVDDFARRRITLTPFRELLYTCPDIMTMMNQMFLFLTIRQLWHSIERHIHK